MRELGLKVWRVARVAGIGAALVVAGGSAARIAESTKPSEATVSTAPPKAEAITRVGADRLTVPAAVVARMGLTTTEVRAAHEPTALPAYKGNLALDANSLQRVHTFPAQASEVANSAFAHDHTRIIEQLGRVVRRQVRPINFEPTRVVDPNRAFAANTINASEHIGFGQL